MQSILLIISHGKYRTDYLFGELMVMICGCATSRLRFRFAITTIVGQYIMYQAVMLASDIMPPESWVADSMLGVCGVVVSLMAA